MIAYISVTFVCENSSHHPSLLRGRIGADFQPVLLLVDYRFTRHLWDMPACWLIDGTYMKVGLSTNLGSGVACSISMGTANLWLHAVCISHHFHARECSFLLQRIHLSALLAALLGLYWNAYRYLCRLGCLVELLDDHPSRHRYSGRVCSSNVDCSPAHSLWRHIRLSGHLHLYSSFTDSFQSEIRPHQEGAARCRLWYCVGVSLSYPSSTSRQHKQTHR